MQKTANAGPWKKLAQRKGLVIKVWHATQIAEAPNNPYAVKEQLDTLLPLVSAKTRLVAFSACSNILGTLIPVKETVAAVRARARELGVRKVEFCIDCVAFAPHRTVHVRNWDVEYAFLSIYKVCPDSCLPRRP